MKILYVYVVTCDSNFSPCIEKNTLTLACCKGGQRGGMRKSVHDSVSSGNEVWILGVCSSSLNQSAQKRLNDNVFRKYKPLYFAKVDEVMEYCDYYADNSPYRGRTDQRAYTVKDNIIVPNDKCNPHAKDKQMIEKDIGGKYVLISHNFSYLGTKCGETQTAIEQKLPCIFSTDEKNEKAGIDKHCRGYIICENLKFNFEEYLCDLQELMKDVPNPGHLSDAFVIDKFDDENNVGFCNCGGNR